MVAVRYAAAMARDAMTKSSSEAALDAARGTATKTLYELCVLMDRHIVTRDAIVRAQRAPTVFDYHQISLIPLAYVVGLIPALLAGVFDGILARRNIGYRVLWCALFGYAMSFIPLLSSLSVGFLHGPFVLMFGLLGAVPGAVCSWIVGGQQRRAA